LKKEKEEREKKQKALQKAAEEKAAKAPQWKTTPQAAPQVQSFAEIQKAESEEMQRLNKIRAQEIEKQKANQINNKSQVNFSQIGSSDWLRIRFILIVLDWLGWPSSWSTTSITCIQCCSSLSRCEFKEICSIRCCPGC